MRRWLRILLGLLILLLVAAAAGAVWVRSELRASLPRLDGTRQLTGLHQPVTVTRDALGIPTIRGASREDVARATGFLHAQDRFFQMDITRRRAAGELSELVGALALAIDREIRIHRFRAEAHRAASLLTPRDRAVLEAYTAGVNEGLKSLGASPFEYVLLRKTPQPWRVEDSLLVVLSMFVTLQDTDGSYESTLATMHDLLPPAMLDFLDPRGTEWDTPVTGPSFSVPDVPGADVYDLRSRRGGKPSPAFRPRRPEIADATPNPLVDRWLLGVDKRDGAIGSNNWAVSGRLTANGGAMLANDMHLAIRVPNTWYRAALEWSDSGPEGPPRRMIGITLPGVPALVVGSNTFVAWGFTNTYADWGDIVLLELDPSNPDRYRTPGGWRSFEHHDEIIHVAGQPDQHEAIAWTIWGPVLGPDHRGRPRAYSWVAHSAERLASAVTPFESAHTVEEAFEAANGLGTPGQNMVVADRSGRIGWSIFGAVPRRVGIDGRLPASWADGSRGWNGWLSASEYPRIVDPPDGRIWTANARVVGGDMLAALGDGSYEVGSRARIIRDRLLARDRFTARDMLDIQLDASAGFLARWRELLLSTLTPSAIQGKPDRAALRDILDRGWSGRAQADSAAYRFTRMFRENVSERVIAFVLVECYDADPAFDYTTVRRREGPIWKLVTTKPQHLLDPAFATWDDLLLASVDAIIRLAQDARSGPLSARVWSEYNVTQYRHPLSAGLPFVGRWLDMPHEALPGDLYTPNMHWRANGASERMVVSPGHEADGLMHMPTGQSGHPLSPYYANSHPAWTKGEPTPFLPGPSEHQLTLMP